MNLNLIKIVGVAVGVAGMTVETRAAEMQEYVAERDNTQVSVWKSHRPEKRLFTSKAVEEQIQRAKKLLTNTKLAWMFENCFPNTLDTTVHFDGADDTFVYTGDIHAMWLRDSGAQVWPYVQLANEDPELKKMLAGVIRRQFKCINIDPYANAFNKEATGSYWASDMTDMKPEVYERKWEIDSLCYPIRLAYHYWKVTGDASVFSDEWLQAVAYILQTFREQQRKEGNGPYHFQRKTERALDTVTNNGWGNPVKPVGLIASAFRPSDDATQYGFLVPSNMFAVVSLRQLAEIENKVYQHTEFAKECTDLSDEIDRAIQKYAIVNHPVCGKIYAFEVDGFGNSLCMDDANVPSLLAAPYLGYCSQDDPLYQNTRKFIWSDNNPYFFSGKSGEGVGGPHVGLNYAWPMSIIIKGLTTDDTNELKDCLTLLRNTDGNTGFMHESFNVNDDNDFTRSWFAWTNTLFGELIVKIHNNHPELLKTTF